MKKLLLVLLCCFAIGAYAQDTIPKKNSIGKFEEQFTVLKSDKKIKHGFYKLLNDKKLIASGSYDKGLRTGVWSFTTKGSLVQQYDFTAKKIISSVPEQGITYNINSEQNDTVVEPMLIGGLSALRFLAANTDYADNLKEIQGKVIVSHSITLNADGKINTWTTMIKGPDSFKVSNPIFTDIPTDLLLFSPAIVNGTKVPSVITFKDQDRVLQQEGRHFIETTTVTRSRGGRGRP